ncbi:MAG TPA: hypothetical protein VF550_13165, partial [Polyangia bacterium]
ASSPKLRQRARASAERAITSLLVILGFAEVHFVDALPGSGFTKCEEEVTKCEDRPGQAA